jgi:hypothetical protein
MGISGRDLALLDGDVDDVEWAANVPGSKDVGLRGLHGWFDDDFFICHPEGGGVMAETFGVCASAHGDENFINGD